MRGRSTAPHTELMVRPAGLIELYDEASLRATPSKSSGVYGGQRLCIVAHNACGQHVLGLNVGKTAALLADTE